MLNSTINANRILRLVSFGMVLALFIFILLPVSGGIASPGEKPLAQTAGPTFSKIFSPAIIGPGSVSTLQFTIENNSPAPVTDLVFTDTLPIVPGEVKIATPANASTDCAEATLTAPDGGATITFSGGRLGAYSTCTILVDVTGSTPGVHTNISGALASSAGDSGTATADLTVVTTLPGFSKSFAPTSISLGGRSTLTFSIDNSANASGVLNLDFTDNLLTGLEIADPANISTNCGTAVLPPTLIAVPGTSSIILDANGTAGFPAVAAGVTCTVNVDVTATGVGRMENITGELLADFVSAGKASATLEVTRDDLHLQKSFIDDPVPPGGTTTLEFTITNYDRSEAATNISFTDGLNNVLSGLAAIGLPTDPCGVGSSLTGTDLLNFTGGNLAPGATCTFSVTLQVPADAVPGTYFNTTSTITGDVGGASIVGAVASETLFVFHAPILTKEFLDATTLLPDPVMGAGDDIVIRFTIANTSNTSQAYDIAFIDELTTFLPFPVSATFPATGFCGPSASMVWVFPGTDRQGLSMTDGSLAAAGVAGDSCTFDVTVSLPVGLPGGIYTNTTEEITAVIDGATRIGLPATDDFVLVAAPRLSKEFTDDPVLPGGTVTLAFTLTHEATAPGDATAITFTDNLGALVPAIPDLTANGLPINDVCGIGSQLSGTTDLTFSGGTLSPGGTCAFSVTLQVPAAVLPGDYLNTTSNVGATVLGVVTTEHPAADILNITGLTFAKEFLGDPVIPGEMVTLRFTIDNTNSPHDATGILFTDNLADVLPGTPDLELLNPLPLLPCGGTLTSFLPTYFDFSGGSVLAGTSCSFDVTLQVPVGAADGDYSNVTSNLTAILDGSVVTLDPAVDTLMVQSDWLLFSKNFIDDPVAPGGIVTLEFAITNTHPISGVVDLTFTDDLTGTLSGLVAVGLPANDVCGGGSSISGTDILTLTMGILGPDASCTFSVTLQVPANATLGNYANITSPVSGKINALDVDGLSASDDLYVSYFNFTKTFAQSVLPGDTVDLSFTIVNPDLVSSAAQIDFTDDLDAVLPGLVAVGLPVSDVCGPGSHFEGTNILTLRGGNLGPDSSCTFSVTLQIPIDALPGSYLNVTSDLTMGGSVSSFPATTSLIIDPYISIRDVTVDEGAGTANFTLSLNGAASREVSVYYATSNATAIAGSDYTAASDTATILTGEITTTVSIPITDDALDENNEIFQVILNNSVNAAIADGQGIGMITDNDEPPTLSVNDVLVDEDAGTATFTVTLSTPSGLDVAVDYLTADGIALAGLDYTGIAPSTLNLFAGTISNTVSVAILEDALDEIDETFTLILNNPVNATVSDGEGIGTILDNDFSIFLPQILKNYYGEIIFYENNFDGGAGDEWSGPFVDTAPTGEQFLGEFATDVITLTLSDLPAHSQVRVSFDLYILRSWDGNNAAHGPDIWELALDGSSLLNTTFSNWSTDNQAYPGFYPGGDYPARTGAVANNTLGYFWNGYPMDATYQLTFTIDHTASDLESVFSSFMFDIGDESWGLDNIEVVLLP